MGTSITITVNGDEQKAEVEPEQADKEPGGNATIPLVFANPLGLQSETKFLHVDRPLSQVQIKLTSDGTIEVLADPK